MDGLINWLVTKLKAVFEAVLKVLELIFPVKDVVNKLTKCALANLILVAIVMLFFLALFKINQKLFLTTIHFYWVIVVVFGSVVICGHGTVFRKD